MRSLMHRPATMQDAAVDCHGCGDGGLQRAPDTFRRLGKAEASMRAAMGGNLGALQCTHPRSDTRVQMLEEELEMMRQHGDRALTRVMHKVPYWML